MGKLNLRVISILTGFWILFQSTAWAQIAINQVGYRPYDNKTAIVFGKTIFHPTKFNLKDVVSNTIQYSGLLTISSIFDTASQETVYQADFTDFNITGTYYIEIPEINASSCTFDIGNNIYSDIYKVAMKSYYYQRSGQELPSKYAGKFARPAGHLKDAIIHPSASSKQISAGTYLENTGGWFDSGDYGKKIVNAGFALGILFNGYEIMSANIKDIKLNIPEIQGMPDFLTEIKYELDWMLKMQRADGAVYHLITTPEFPNFSVMPDQDKQNRCIVQVSSCATGIYSAVMARAYLIYREYDSAYASKLLLASKKAWVYLAKNPNIVPAGGYRDPAGINNTGLYEDINDKDERFWAAVELYRATGEAKYNKYIKKHFSDWEYPVVYPANWKDVHNLGMFTYLTTNKPGVDVKIQHKIKNSLKIYAQQILNNINSSGFKTALLPEDYYWGSSSLALMYGTDLIMISTIMPHNLYVQGAVAQLNYIFGTNSLGMSFVTGVGKNTPKNPAQIVTEADDIKEPIPGFLVGGPNGYLNDPIIKKYQQDAKLPVAKCYIDSPLSYSTNEVSLSWNAPLVFLAGYFMNSTK